VLQWSDEYRLGIDSIDAQHKHLFDIANKAYHLLLNDLRLDKYDEIVEIIEELRNYAVTHFNTEEQYMASIRYPKLLSHKVEHNDFMEKINSVNLDEIDENQDRFLLEILDFIADWLQNHILKVDRQFAPNK